MDDQLRQRAARPGAGLDRKDQLLALNGGSVGIVRRCSGAAPPGSCAVRWCWPKGGTCRGAVVRGRAGLALLLWWFPAGGLG